MTKNLDVTTESEFVTMLGFYHDLGIIIYFGGENKTNSYLQDIVILNPQWLIDIFKRIITVLPPQKQVYFSYISIFQYMQIYAIITLFKKKISKGLALGGKVKYDPIFKDVMANVYLIYTRLRNLNISV